MAFKMGLLQLGVLIVTIVFVEHVKCQSSLGKEFALAFPPVREDATTGICTIIINSFQDTSVTISTATGSTTTVVLEGRPFNYDVPCDERTEGGVESKVYRISSNSDITVMASSESFADEGQIGATLVYPQEDISTEFYLLIYVDPDGGNYQCGGTLNTASYYVISAFEDNTAIDIYESGTYDLILSFVLNEYECYTNTTTVSDRYFDFSGYYIQSNKPVSVSAGSACTHYASSTSDESGITWGSVPPVASLSSGTHVTYEIKEHTSNYYEVLVLAIEGDTDVSIGSTDFTLNRGEKASYELFETFETVECSKPCHVIQINFNYLDDSGIFLLQVSPVTQYNERVVVAPAPVSLHWVDYVIINVQSLDYDQVIETEGLYTGASWDCKTLSGTYTCQLHTYFIEDQARVWSIDPDVKFSAVVYSQGSFGEGYGYNAGYNVLNISIPDTEITTPPPAACAPLAYQITHRGDFVSSTGADFSDECATGYRTEMKERAAGMMSYVNSQIGTPALCGGVSPNDMSILSVSTSFLTDGPEGLTYLLWPLSVGGALLIGSVQTCATEIALFLGDHNNWNSPILPDLPGCPGVRYLSDNFNVTEYEWLCLGTMGTHNRTRHGQTKELAATTLQYLVSHSGSLNTDDGTDITGTCLLEHTKSLQASTTSQVIRINGLIGSDICAGKTASISTASSELVASGSQATSTLDYVIESGPDLTFEEACACADEISIYLQPHDNWEQPIIPPSTGCPDLEFNPARFVEDSKRWLCGF